MRSRWWARSIISSIGCPGRSAPRPRHSCSDACSSPDSVSRRSCLLGAAAVLTRLLTEDRTASTGRVALRYAYGLVPFGFGMWLAHYGFHLLTGALTVVPVTQSAAIDLAGWPALGDPLWRWAGMRPGAVFPIQLGCVLLGTVGSFAVMHLISLRDYPDRPARATMPWAVVLVLLAAAAHLGAVPADGDERDGADRMNRVADSAGVRLSLGVGAIVFCAIAVAQAHSGPPFPIVSNQTSGAYTVSVWTDPDSTRRWIGGRPVLDHRASRRRCCVAARRYADRRDAHGARSARPAGNRSAPSRLPVMCRSDSRRS